MVGSDNSGSSRESRYFRALCLRLVTVALREYHGGRPNQAELHRFAALVLDNKRFYADRLDRRNSLDLLGVFGPDEVLRRPVDVHDLIFGVAGSIDSVTTSGTASATFTGWVMDTNDDAHSTSVDIYVIGVGGRYLANLPIYLTKTDTSEDSFHTSGTGRHPIMPQVRALVAADRPLSCVGRQVRSSQRPRSVKNRSTSSSSTSASSARSTTGPATHQSAPGRPAE